MLVSLPECGDWYGLAACINELENGQIFFGDGLQVGHIPKFCQVLPEISSGFALIFAYLEEVHPSVENRVQRFELCLQHIEASCGAKDSCSEAYLPFQDLLERRVKGLEQIALLGGHRLLLQANGIVGTCEMQPSTA